MSAAIDANVLLYASDRASPLHERALEEIERLAAGPEPLYLFWPVTIAYLRIATHPATFEAPLAFSDAARNVGRLLDRGHVRSPGRATASGGPLGRRRPRAARVATSYPTLSSSP